MPTILISISEQLLYFFDRSRLESVYPVSTAANGVGERINSEKTPRGVHIIRARIGANCPINTVFVGRRPTGEIYSPALGQRYPDRDWILTRILWLSGKEVGKNRLGDVDTMRRMIYIHGFPDEQPINKPSSRGCIRMRNRELIWLFNRTPLGTWLNIIK